MALNLGKLTKDVEEFLAKYRTYGYATKTEMTIEALRVLRREKAAQTRAEWRKAAALEYSPAKDKHHWKDVDGDDFK